MIASESVREPAPAPAHAGPHWALNLILFQAAWLATVMTASHGAAWIGLVSVAAAIAVHLIVSDSPGAEVRLLFEALLVGIAVEHGMLWSGLIQYPGDPAFVPLWMLALWPLFATTLNTSLRWLHEHLLLAALLGAIAGPLAYLGGQALGAIVLPDPASALAALALIWAIATPALSGIARLLESEPTEGRRP